MEQSPDLLPSRQHSEQCFESHVLERCFSSAITTILFVFRFQLTLFSGRGLPTLSGLCGSKCSHQLPMMKISSLQHCMTVHQLSWCVRLAEACNVHLFVALASILYMFCSGTTKHLHLCKGSVLNLVSIFLCFILFSSKT